MADLDPERLRERTEAAAHRWRPDASVGSIEELTGGSSSLTYTTTIRAGDDGERDVVLKLAPPGLAPVRNRDVLRQARLLRALEGADGVRVPTVLFDDAGDPPDEPPFFAMPFVGGDCFEPILQAGPQPEPDDVIRARELAAARMLAKLHAVDPATVGLGDEPALTLEDEIARWVRAFGTVEEGLRTGYERAAELLGATIPPALPPVVNHGDYRLGNMLCQGNEIAAIIDWEIWALQDPRVDLGWFLLFTNEAQHPSAAGNPPAPGVPSPEELMAVYVETRGEPLPDFAWFEALIRFKEASASALLTKRAMKAGIDDPDRLVTPVLTLIEQTIEQLEPWVKP